MEGESRVKLLFNLLYLAVFERFPSFDDLHPLLGEPTLTTFSCPTFPPFGLDLKIITIHQNVSLASRGKQNTYLRTGIYFCSSGGV